MKKEIPWIIGIIIAIVGLFFYKTALFGLVPIPADIVVSDFQPWRSASYLGYAAGGIPNKAQYPDVIRQMYPWKTLAIESLKQGKLPLWNPYNFSGAPLLANFQSAPLYPLNIVYFLLSHVDSWTVLVILQPLLAALFTYFYARKIRMGPLGSTLSALSYGFSGFMAVWLEYNTVGHVVLWLPMILLAIEHNQINPRVLWLGVLVFAHAAAILAGHPQVYAYMATFSIFYAMYRLSRGMKGYVLGFTALGMGIAGVQIIPGIELIANAARSPHDPANLFTNILLQPWQLLALPFPNFFGNPATRTYWLTDTFVGKVTTIGLVPLFFVLSAFRRKDALTKWFIAAAGIILLCITNNPLTQLLYRIPIPLLTSSSPTLMSFLFVFSLSIACGFGLEYWRTDTHSVKKLIRRAMEVAALIGGIFATTGLPFIPALHNHAPIINRALIYGGLVSGAILLLFWIAIKMPKVRNQAIVLLLVIHTLDLFIFFNRFNPFVPKALVFPQHPILSYLRDKSPDRYWGYGTANVAANFASQYRMFSPEGYDPLYPKWYGEFLYSYRDGKPLTTFDTATRSDAAITSHFGDGGLSDTKKQAVLNALSVRYILDRAENGSDERIFPPEIFQKIFTFKDWSVYENTKADRRVYRESGTAKIVSYEPERITILTESTVSGIVVLTDTYYPGWKASVDGIPTTVQRTDTAMRAIPAPAGYHTIVVEYNPDSVRHGIALSMISMGITFLVLVYIGRKHI